SDAKLHFVRDARQFAVNGSLVLLVEDERHERRRCRHDRVAEAPCELEARPVAAAFRQRLTTGREYDVFSLDCSAGGSDPEATLTSRDVEHTPPGNQLHARRIGSSQE